MSLMLLSQASLFADKGLIGLGSKQSVVMSGDGNIVIAYNVFSGTEIDIFKKVNGGWNRVSRTLTTPGSSWNSFVELKLSFTGEKIAYLYSTTGGYNTDRIAVVNLNLSDLSLSSAVVATTSFVSSFDVNSSAVGYWAVSSPTQCKIVRLTTMLEQTIILPNSFSSLFLWFNEDISVNFKWAGVPDLTQSQNNVSIGYTNVTSTTTYTHSNLTNKFGLYGRDDFASDSFTVVGVPYTNTPNVFEITTSTTTYTFTPASIGLPNTWRFDIIKVSSDGSRVIALMFQPSDGKRRLAFFSRNTAGAFIFVGDTPLSSNTLNGLNFDSAGISIILSSTSGPQLYLI